MSGGHSGGELNPVDLPFLPFVLQTQDRKVQDLLARHVEGKSHSVQRRVSLPRNADACHDGVHSTVWSYHFHTSMVTSAATESNGGAGRTRTDKTLRSRDFESRAFAISPQRQCSSDLNRFHTVLNLTRPERVGSFSPRSKRVGYSIRRVQALSASDPGHRVTQPTAPGRSPTSLEKTHATQTHTHSDRGLSSSNRISTQSGPPKSSGGGSFCLHGVRLGVVPGRSNS